MDSIIKNNYENQIITLLNSIDNQENLLDSLSDYHDYEIAKAISNMPTKLRNKLYSVLPNKTLSDVFEELHPEIAFNILEETSLDIITRIFKDMQVDNLVDIIKYSDDEEDKITYLSLVNSSKRDIVRELLNYDDSLVGSIMNNTYINVNKQDTIKEAIKKVVIEAPENEYINDIYVTEDGVLIGVFSLKELIFAGNNNGNLISDIMSKNLVYVYPSTKNEDALLLMQNYDFQILPVVDKYRKLIGIITFDDMFDTQTYESEMDYSGLAGVSEVSIDENETVIETIKKRLPWLIILLFINIITSEIITSFEHTLRMLPILAIFMPLISSMAGNSGTQSLGIIIRLFAKNELNNTKSIYKHLFNEFLTGLVNGLIIGTTLFIIVIVFNLFKGVAVSESLGLALIIAFSINVALIVSNISGTIIPLIIKSFKIDPAVASGPFITTINDIFSLLIYFSLATVLIAQLS